MKVMRLRRADILIAAGSLLVALALFLVFRTTGEGGRAVIQVTGQEALTVSLDKPTVMELDGRDGLSVTVEVADGRIRVSRSDCPDQICVHTGWVSHNGQAVACVPAGISVRVIRADNRVDGVTA